MTSKQSPPREPAAGNGLLSRRIFLEGALVTGATGVGLTGAAGDPLAVAPWMKAPGPHFVPYGQPSHFEGKVVRAVAPPANPAVQGVGSSRTPLHLLDGMMTPSGLHSSTSTRWTRRIRAPVSCISIPVATCRAIS